MKKYDFDTTSVLKLKFPYDSKGYGVKKYVLRSRFGELLNLAINEITRLFLMQPVWLLMKLHAFF